jgi:two-component system NtrC family sensor kinase
MNSSGENKKYFRLFIKTRLFTVFCFSVIPIILVSSIILYQFKTSYYAKIYVHLETLVKKHRLNIDSFLNEKLGDIRLIASGNPFENLSTPASLEQELRSLQQAFGPVFVDLGVINSDGVQVAYAGPFMLEEAVYSDADWFKNAMQSQYVISDVFLGLRGLPHFIVAVREYSGGKPWVLRATIDFAAFNDLVKNVRIGETGFAFILNKDGQLQTQTNFEIALNKGPYLELLNRGTADEIQSTRDTGTQNDNIYIAAFLKNGDWLLVYQQSAAEAFSDFQKAFGLGLIIILLGSIATITLAFIRYKNMTKKIEKVELERKKMDKQIIETGKLAAVGELAAGIAHEINNPVAIMVEEAGWIEDLLEEEEFQGSTNLDEFHRALRQINTQGKRCKEITHKLLSFARKTDVDTQDVMINKLIRQVVELSAQRAKFENVVISTNLEESLPSINISESELQQVLLNLINNAIDAIENKTGEIEISTRQEKSSVVIAVSDNGTGIPKANLDKIFDPFYTTKPVGKGTGLGLSICYGIINKMGGKIEVQSKLDQGSSFTIRIPLKKYKE